MGSGRPLLLPDAVKVWQGMELFISGDQRPATVKCRGRDQAISWIAMLKQGAAGENSDISRDWQDLQPKGLQHGALAQNRGIWVSQMICITTPLHTRDPLNHIAKGDAITQSQ